METPEEKRAVRRAYEQTIKIEQPDKWAAFQERNRESARLAYARKKAAGMMTYDAEKRRDYWKRKRETEPEWFARELEKRRLWDHAHRPKRNRAPEKAREYRLRAEMRKKQGTPRQS